MTITDTTLIGDIAARVPSSVRVFQRHGVDFCCGGRRTLADACEEQGLSPEDLAREIQQSATAPAAEERDWTNVSLAELSEHIVRTYHEPLREELPRIAQMAARVAEVHRARGGAVLERIHAIADDLAEDLIEHMKKEERILFPAIRALERHGVTVLRLRDAIEIMEDEHDRAGGLLAELRSLTNGYHVPSWGCATTRSLFWALADLESAMEVHVHLENNVLFPRALSLARGHAA